MKTFIALVKREILEGKNGYLFTPAILAGVTILLILITAAGFGSVIHMGDMEIHDIRNFGDALNQAAQKPDAATEMPSGITIGYWAMSILSWIAFPFVVFFSLLSSLYEERRDRSILFWKSMPVADWQEVLAKLVAPVLVAPFIFLGVAIVAQLVIALVLSLVSLAQGGPLMVLWPLGLMFTSWFAFIADYLIWALWALPVFGWILLVSSYASRMPFLWVILAPAVLMVMEGLLLDTHVLANWVGVHLGAWQDSAFSGGPAVDINGPRDILKLLLGAHQWESLKYSLASLHFWAGLVVAAGFVYGAIEMRKRAV